MAPDAPRRFDSVLVAGWTRALGPALAASLPAWIAEHEAAGDPDPDRFLADLRASRRIDGAAHRRALLVRGVPVIAADPGSSPAPPGVAVHGRFALLGEIGRGGQGTVYVARDLGLGRKVAFKIESQGPVTPEGRFAREAQITAQREHPNIVPVHELLRLENGQRAYAMKVIEGRTLAEVVMAAWLRHQQRGRVNEPRELAERLEYFLKVCDAVGYAHARGVVHRDLKPDNVMIGPHREVYVMDWGVARLLDGDGPEPAPQGSPDTQRGEAVGTPMYMSPEQARGEAVGPASDQYALGVMLQELVTLQPAVRAPHADLALYHAGRAMRAPMLHLRAGVRVSPDLVAIVDRATAPDPAGRYADVEVLAEEVRSYLRGDEIRALPDGWVRRWSRSFVRHREGQYGQLAEAISAAATILLAVGSSPGDGPGPPALRFAPA